MTNSFGAAAKGGYFLKDFADTVFRRNSEAGRLNCYRNTALH